MTTTVRRPRLRRSDCSGPGLSRVRRGRGFGYVDQDRRRISEAEVLERVRGLAIPPAWQTVWICADPLGHLQATGIDAAGRKQYLYHPLWRERRDHAKFERMILFAQALPQLRRRLAADLDGAEPSRERVLALAVRLLDVGLFRIGGEEYAESGGGLGLATIRREHVAIRDGAAVFDYPAKGGVRRVHAIDDPLCLRLVRALKRRRGGEPQLLAYRDRRRWVSVSSDEVNSYLKQQIGEEFSAKDFRTWNATVIAAVALAASGHDAKTKTARQRVVKQTVGGVAEVLGNTPAVARRAYIDPRVFDRYLLRWTIAPAVEKLSDPNASVDRTRLRLERAVLDLLAENRESDALGRIAS
jgi:DNA topoisomerase I